MTLEEYTEETGIKTIFVISWSGAQDKLEIWESTTPALSAFTTKKILIPILEVMEKKEKRSLT